MLSLTVALSSVFCGFMPSISVFAAENKTTIDELIKNMTLRDKIAQMMMVSFRTWKEEANAGNEEVNFTVMNEEVTRILETYPLGAVIYFAQNLEETKQSYELTMELQKTAVRTY